MTPFRRSVDCEYARALAAHAPDGELSDFESSSLDLHLAMCASCSAFAAQVERTTLLLREGELVRPSQPVSLRLASRRRSVAARARPVAAVAAVALMTLGVAARAPLPVDERSSPLRVTAPAPAVDQIELLSLRERRQPVQVEPAPAPAVMTRPYPV